MAKDGLINCKKCGTLFFKTSGREICEECFNKELEVIDGIKNSSPKLLLVALGAPMQEEFIYELKSILPSTLMIGIGGSFDVWAGEVQRAPEIWQKLGLEWLYRTIKQPERFKRIFPTLPIFVYNVIKERLTKKG